MRDILTSNLKLIEYYEHVDGDGEFIAWTVLFNDLDRGSRMVAMIYAHILPDLAMHPIAVPTQ